MSYRPSCQTSSKLIMCLFMINELLLTWHACVHVCVPYRICMCCCKSDSLGFEGNWLLTGPNEFPKPGVNVPDPSLNDSESQSLTYPPLLQRGFIGGTHQETLGSLLSQVRTMPSAVRSDHCINSKCSTTQPYSSIQGDYILFEDQNKENEAD